jgi:biopolymer transport protein ExbB
MALDSTATSAGALTATAWAYWRAGGWVMLPLSLCAFFIWFRYFTLWRILHDALAAPVTFAEELCQRLASPGASGTALAAWVAGFPGLLPRLMHRSLAVARAGTPLPAALAQGREIELALFQRAFYFLGALVTAAPLLGLLGTVLGMRETFAAVARGGAQTPTLLGGGISQALITTQAGLLVALPGTFGLAHLYRLYQRLSHAVRHLESLLAHAPAPPPL